MTREQVPPLLTTAWFYAVDFFELGVSLGSGGRQLFYKETASNIYVHVEGGTRARECIRHVPAKDSYCLLDREYDVESTLVGLWVDV